MAILEEPRHAAEVDAAVRAAVSAVVRRRHADRAAVRDDDRLIDDLGFDSLDLAQVVAQLEIDLGVDPFRAMSVGSVRTVGQLCAAYHHVRPPHT